MKQEHIQQPLSSICHCATAHKELKSWHSRRKSDSHWTNKPWKTGVRFRKGIIRKLPHKETSMLELCRINGVQQMRYKAEVELVSGNLPRGFSWGGWSLSPPQRAERPSLGGNIRKVQGMKSLLEECFLGDLQPQSRFSSPQPSRGKPQWSEPW